MESNELTNNLVNSSNSYSDGEESNSNSESNSQTKCLKIINNNYKDFDKDERQMDILTFYFNSMNSYYNTKLILLDVNDYYITILIENLNTFSLYCLEKSYFDLDVDDNSDGDSDNDNNKTNIMELSEICKKLYVIYNKQKFSELIN
jgi:hypothetical protein